MDEANKIFNQLSKEPTMDFVVTQTSKCVNADFQFVAVSDAAKRFLVDRLGDCAVGFSVDLHHFGPTVQDILYENLTIQMQ
jgi:hypothetical protein